MLNNITNKIVKTIRSVMRWGSRGLASVIVFFVVRKLFPWPFRKIGMNLTRKYGPGIVRAARPYAQRGVDTVSSRILRRGHTLQPVPPIGMNTIDTMDTIPEM